MTNHAVPAPAAGILLPIGLAVSAALGFAVTDALSKFLTGALPPLEVAWGRAVMSGIVASALLGRAGWQQLRSTPNMRFHLLRGLLSAVVPTLAVYSVGLLPLALFTSIVFLSPVLMTMLSVPILGERVGPRRWAAVVIGFVATVIIIQPAGEAFGWAVALPVACAILGAFYPILTRLAAPGSSHAAQLALGPGLGAVLMTLVVPFVWVTPELPEAGILLLCGLLHAGCHLLVIRAFAAAPTSVLAPFQYVQLPCSVLVGYFAFSELPRATTVAGGGLLVAAGVYIAYREHKLSRAGRM
ncbi:MAG: DMT family transporter [Alphaproteobacteria bacterium]